MDGALRSHHRCFHPAQTLFTPHDGDALKKGDRGDRFVKTKGQVYADLQVSEAH